MSNKEVINTLISDYSIQAKLSERERLIYEYGILNGMDIANQMMMNDAVDIEYDNLVAYDIIYKICQVLGEGGKGKLVIVKQEEK